MTRKDPDKQAVYYSEEIAFAGTSYAEPLHGNDLLGLAAEMFLTGWWDRLKIPVPTIEPTKSKDTSSYATATFNRTGYSYNIIRLAPCDINPWTLAHEAAHIAQFYFYDINRNPNLETHGREFRACYLNVAETLLGREAAKELRINFDRRFPVRPEHAPGKPGSILTVPGLRDEDRALDPTGVGIFGRWRLKEQLKEVTTLQDRLSAANPPANNRLNGAIAL